VIAARLRLLALALTLAGLCGAASCGGIPIVGPAAEEPGVPPAQEVEGSQILANAGGGDLPVHGASLYSAGQKIFRELRQEETLNAFLDCRGEPDLVRVAPEARKVTLTYRRAGIERRGTVDITWSAHGYWVAGPLKPLELPGAAPTPVAPQKASPAPAPRPAPAPSPEAAPEAPAPAGEPVPETPEAPETPPPPEEMPAPEPTGPQPTDAQRHECPIEPWRSDCKQLCVEGAAWEWCEYGKKPQ
jgi:hypothetical protein